MKRNKITEVVTTEAHYEYRILEIVKETLGDVGAEVEDFDTTDDLLDFLFSEDIRNFLGLRLVEDMTEWTDDWLEQLKGE